MAEKRWQMSTYVTDEKLYNDLKAYLAESGITMCAALLAGIKALLAGKIDIDGNVIAGAKVCQNKAKAKQTSKNKQIAQVFGAFLNDRMDRANMYTKELSYHTKIPMSTISKYRQTNSQMPCLYRGLLLLEALGSKHAKALMEIWRSWKNDYFDCKDKPSC